MQRIIIIGGGAAGMAAAIAAAKTKAAEVTIIEKNLRLGKKLLATGNGRCNITNTLCTEKNFHGGAKGFVSSVLAAFNVKDTLEFFEGIGLVCKETEGGRVYPYSMQASAVLDVLRCEADGLGVKVISETEVIEARQKRGGFVLWVNPGDSVSCDRLIVATGGKAAPSTGSTGGGFTILESMGHRIHPVRPALCPLKTETTLAAGMQGVRLNGKARLEKSGLSAEGEIQFAAYGLTGPAIFEISGEALAHSGETVSLDLTPEFSVDKLTAMLSLRRERLGSLPLEGFMTGFLNKKVGQILVKAATGRKLSELSKNLTDDDIKKLTGTIKNLRFPVHGHTGWENAQATAGGADTREFSTTLESLTVPGLFACGEVLDIYGDCGGHNLQWAWSSGYTAGVNSVC